MDPIFQRREGRRLLGTSEPKIDTQHWTDRLPKRGQIHADEGACAQQKHRNCQLPIHHTEAPNVLHQIRKGEEKSTKQR